MTPETLERVLIVLEQHHPKGLGVFTLSEKSGVSVDDLRRFLPKYPDYFVSLPDTKQYAINRFGPFKGVRESMVADHMKRLESQKTSSFWVCFIIFAGCFAAIMAAIMNAK